MIASIGNWNNNLFILFYMELREQSVNPEIVETDQILENGQEVQNVNEEVVNPEAVTAEEPTKEQLIELAAELAEKPAAEIAQEANKLKQQFHAIRKKEIDAEKAEFIAKGNEEAAFAPHVDELEEKFKEIMAVIKEKKAAYIAELEAQRQANFERKNAIIDQILEIAADTDNVNRHFDKIKDLQQEFKSIGEVPATEMSEQWKRFQDAIERYYDQLKINKDLRDYDFKKNLEIKQLLIAEAQKLDDEADVIVAFRRLQDLHEKWRETGPVAKDIREEIWAQFKDASATVNKKYQAHFEERKSREQENENAKTAICERVEALDFESLKSAAAWDEMTKTILAAQEDWKKLGFASKKMNNALFARFRQTCDRFFEMKADFFKRTKDELATNLEKKIALCERAEALKDSTDWKKTTDELVALQKEWKTVGTVAKKHSDTVWKRFLAACDYFFEQKKKSTSGARRTEQANLAAKKEVIEQIAAIDNETPRDQAIAKVKELMAQWQQIGHVPFKEKDAVYEAYRKAVNEAYERFDIKETKANFANFENSINEMSGNKDKLYRERERLVRAYEQKKGELQTYQNNLGFFNSKSKSGDSMVREMERKMQRIKDDIEVLEKKIGVIDSKL